MITMKAVTAGLVAVAVAAPIIWAPVVVVVILAEEEAIVTLQMREVEVAVLTIPEPAKSMKVR